MTRAERNEQIMALRREGLGCRRIAKVLGLSVSRVCEATSDPDGSRARERKDSYRGVCIDCGGPTSGAEGRGAYLRCLPCANAHARAQKYWTRERIIDAIQRFAAANGRPPVADEWIKGDPLNDYPPRCSVYRSHRTAPASVPFASWADAIEAAGYSRPHRGSRRARERSQVAA